jgi:hypothetical protein
VFRILSLGYVAQAAIEKLRKDWHSLDSVNYGRKSVFCNFAAMEQDRELVSCGEVFDVLVMYRRLLKFSISARFSRLSIVV